ncbi:MAG: LamB/YcsF family protein, partial [Lysobacter sp.]
VAARDPNVADAIAMTVAAFDASLILFGLSGSALPAAGTRAGLRVAHEVFAERGYGDDGQLLPRDTPGAVIESIDDAIAQVRELATSGAVMSVNGRRLALRADTLCLHGDRVEAASFAQSLRRALEADAVRILPVGATA